MGAGPMEEGAMAALQSPSQQVWAYLENLPFCVLCRFTKCVGKKHRKETKSHKVVFITTSYQYIRSVIFDWLVSLGFILSL